MARAGVEPDINEEDVSLQNLDATAGFPRLIRASFNQRRKTLANGLKNASGLSFSREQIEQALTICGFPVSVRGETLSLTDFARLSDAFTDLRPS